MKLPEEIKQRWKTRATEARALYAAKLAESSKPKGIVVK
jgi:hypothetical protein